jgi:hypothetical protein
MEKLLPLILVIIVIVNQPIHIAGTLLAIQLEAGITKQETLLMTSPSNHTLNLTRLVSQDLILLAFVFVLVVLL